MQVWLKIFIKDTKFLPHILTLLSAWPFQPVEPEEGAGEVDYIRWGITAVLTDQLRLRNRILHCPMDLA